jgi:hypothetical protein
MPVNCRVGTNGPKWTFVTISNVALQLVIADIDALLQHLQ